MIKGGFLASFFLIIFFNTALLWSQEDETPYDKAKLKAMSESPIWSVLLHARHEKSYIRDPKFFLAGYEFNKFSELEATLKAFSGHKEEGSHHAICRFPARYLWLKQELGFKDSEFEQPDCSEYLEFQKKVPVDQVQLVFASENIVSPSSMMGHVFLKLSGKTESSYVAEHAVTYFTVLNSLNVPRIIYENFTGGMLGIFALQPYQKMKRNYLVSESRNLWEYSIPLSKNKLDLLRAHIWELKGVSSDYLFTDYNCATLTYDLLSLISPQLFDEQMQWISPIDVVKQAKKYNLINQTQILTANQWKIKMLLDKVKSGSAIKQKIDDADQYHASVNVDSLKPEEKLLALSYIHYLQSNEPNFYENKSGVYQQLGKELTQETSSYVLDYSRYKDPAKIPGTQQVQVAYGKYNGKAFIDLGFLPAANRLTDDQRQYFSARELKMAELNVRIRDDKTTKLNYFNIYAVKSLNPWDVFTRSVSGQWQLNFEQHYDEQLHQHLVLNLSAGLGYTASLGDDVSLSMLYNIGLATNVKSSYIYHYPELVMQVDEIFNMKSTLLYKSNFNMYNSNDRNENISFCQSHYPEQDITLLFCFDRVQNRTKNINEAKAVFQQHF